MGKDKRYIEVGVYPFGFGYVKVFADLTSGNGSVDLLPDNKGITEIYVGAGPGVNWSESVSTLLHEAYELTLIELNTRYKIKPSYSGESSDYMFFVSHNQLGEAHERVGEFLIKVMPEFEKVHKAIKRSLEEQKNKKRKNKK